MTVDFTSRCVIVTGAGHGLGRAFALDLASRGAAVVVNDIAQSTADLVASEIRGCGGRAVAVVASVAEPEGATAIVEAGREHFGRVDALVNNAGIVRPLGLADLTVDNLDAHLAVNLRGAVLVAQRAFAAMAVHGAGRIVSIASGAGLFGIPGLVAYAATKAALVGVTKTIALEGAPHGIAANAVLPYAVTNPGRTTLDWPREDVEAIAARASPEWVTPLVTYFASDACTVSGRIYSSVAGRYARVAAGLGRGWVAPGARPPTPDTIHDRFAEIDALDGALWPDTFADEITQVARDLRANPTPSEGMSR